jgi:hypothetical protein
MRGKLRINPRWLAEANTLCKPTCQRSQTQTLTYTPQHGGDPFPDELENPDLQSKVNPAGFDSHQSHMELPSEMYDDDMSIDERSSMRSGVSKSQVPHLLYSSLCVRVCMSVSVCVCVCVCVFCVCVSCRHHVWNVMW